MSRSVAMLHDLGLDAWTWGRPTPRGAETDSSSALLALPDAAERATAAACESVRQALLSERVTLWRYDQSSGTARVVRQMLSPTASQRGLGTRRWRDVRLDESDLLAAVVLGGRPVVVDVADDPVMPAALRAALHFGSLRGDPLQIDGTIVGGLTAEPAPIDADAYLAGVLPFLAAGMAQAAAWRDGNERRAQSEVLLGLIESASREPSLQPLLAGACQELARLGEVDRACAFLRHGDDLVPTMARYADGRRDEHTWNLFRSAPVPLPLVDEVLRRGAPVVAHGGHELLAGWWADTFGITNALAVPIGRHPDLAGVLTLDTTRHRPFTRDVVRLASAAGSHLGGVIQQAQTSRQHETSLRGSRAVRDLLVDGAKAGSVSEAVHVLANAVQRVAGTERSVAYLVDDQGRCSQILEIVWPPQAAEAARARLLGQPATDIPLWVEAVAGQEPVFVEDVANSQLLDPALAAELSLQSYVALPVLCSGRAAGLVVTGSWQRRERWTEQVRDTIRQLSLEGSLVIENAALRAAEQGRLATLAAEAQQDPLTRLANRRTFRARLDTALREIRPGASEVAVMFLDLDRFKLVNDGLGHEAGDQLLITVAERLQAAVSTRALVARLGGDEFGVLLNATCRDEAVALAHRLVDALAEPVTLPGLDVVVGASIGIALWDEPADASDILHAADVAMYQAKRRGRGRVELYEPGTAQPNAGDLHMEMALRRAVDQNELYLEYQPQIEVATGQIVGLEALVRWQQPGQAPVPPGHFLPVAEQTGLINLVDAHVLALLCRDATRFPGGLRPLDLAVNCSAARLLHPELIQDVRRAVHAVAPNRLVIEVTETALLADPAAASQVLAQLRQAGALVSLDDFGTGQSSLNHLRQLPVDQIKIDRSFTAGIPDSPADTAIVASVVMLGNSLGLSVVAEGVETARQLNVLQHVGCSLAQGFHLSRPLPLNAVIALLPDGS